MAPPIVIPKNPSMSFFFFWKMNLISKEPTPERHIGQEQGLENQTNKEETNESMKHFHQKENHQTWSSEWKSSSKRTDPVVVTKLESVKSILAPLFWHYSCS